MRKLLKIIGLAVAGHAALITIPAHAKTVVVRNVAELERTLAEVRRGAGTDRIELAEGEYSLSAPLLIDERLSGTPDKPLIITARAGARVTLSGARRLQGLNWVPWKNGIWRSKVGGATFQWLWQDDKRLVRARYPNYDPAILPLGGYAADAVSPERIARWRNPAGGVLHALHGGKWGGVHIPILGKDSAGKPIFGSSTGNNRDAPPHATFRFVENILEELDAPGEWYHDAKEQWLYFKPSDGRRPLPTGFAAGQLETLIRIESRGAPVRDVRIENLELRQTEPTFLKATEPLLRSDWKFYRSGAVTLENAERVTIANLDIRDIGGNGIVISGYGKALRLTGNHIRAIGGTAIALVGRPEAVRSPLFEYSERLALAEIDRTPGPARALYPSDSEASDNLIHDIGLVDKQAAGIQIAMAARITVDHNSIYRVPRAGINIGDGSWGGHRILNNDVFETVLETGDHGAFNSWGRDRFWHPVRDEMDRRAAADPSLILLDAVEPVVLRRNRFHCSHGWDIDLDDGSSNYVIEDNLLLSGGLKLREGFFRVVRNNIMINNTFHPHVWFPNSGDVFERNVVMSAYEPIGVHDWGRAINRNLFVTESDLAAARRNGTDQNSAFGDPEFVAPAEGNYALSPGSPAFALGFSNFAMDHFGVRPARLRALAEQPAFPEPRPAMQREAGEAAQLLAGMTVKSIETLGEQSAAGMLDKNGVLILSVATGGAAEKAGLRPGDVILGIAGRSGVPARMTPDATSLINAFQTRKWQASLPLMVLRNQQGIELVIDVN
jgi:hypothetical protein